MGADDWACEVNPYTVAFWERCFLPMLRPRMKHGQAFPCLEWMGLRTPEGGHGAFFGLSDKPIYTHRYVYEMVTGVALGDVVVMHDCDNAACCNPFHLKIGDNQQNRRDQLDRGALSRAREKAFRPFKSGYIKNRFGVDRFNIWTSTLEDVNSRLDATRI